MLGSRARFKNIAAALLLAIMMCHRVEAITWLSLKEEEVRGWTEGAAGDVVSDEGGPACDRAKEMGVAPCSALLYVARAAALAKSTCKQISSLRRWNCSTIDLAPDFTPELLVGTREQSFVYALSAAALTHTMARACSAGALASCACGRPPRASPDAGGMGDRDDFKWGGCSDDVRWAARFVRQFVEKSTNLGEYERYDAESNHVRMLRERNRIRTAAKKRKKKARRRQKAGDEERAGNDTIAVEVLRGDVGAVAIVGLGKKTGAKSKARKKEAIVRRDTGQELIKDADNTKRDKKQFDRQTLEKRLKRLEPLLAAANLQNSKAGRKLIERSLAVRCKCHGVSGSCSVRTCWRALEPLPAIAERLWEAAERSEQAQPKTWAIARRGRGGGGAGAELMHVSRSPSYCAEDAARGSLGTRGRWCNATMHSSTEGSCRYLCCGRGYQTYTNETMERCNCRYIWCCKVECDVCKTTASTYYCN